MITLGLKIDDITMIDMPSTDYSCIYLTMSFVLDLAGKYAHGPVLIFDQPLYWKAMEITTHKQQKGSFNKMVIILGTFHTFMRFYGSIGYIMTGSDIQSLLELIYAEHIVPHILSGKAFACATQAHLITAGVLSVLLIGITHNIDFDLNVNDENFALKFNEALNGKEELSKLAQIMHEILTKKIASDGLAMLHDHIISIQEKLEHYKENLHENKTAKLWLTNTEMVNTVCKITKAQGVCNWLLRLEAISEWLPYFAAIGHNLYAKSAYLYLQSMIELSSTNPDVYQMFINGHHVVWWSDSFFFFFF